MYFLVGKNHYTEPSSRVPTVNFETVLAHFEAAIS